MSPKQVMLHVTLCRQIGCLRLYWQVPNYLIHCYERNCRASATACYSTSNSVADAYQKSPLEKQPRVRTPREVALTFYFYSQDHDSQESDAVLTCYSRREYQSISNIVSSSYTGGAANFDSRVTRGSWETTCQPALEDHDSRQPERKHRFLLAYSHHKGSSFAFCF